MLQNTVSGKRKAYAIIMRTLMALATLMTGALVLFLIVYVLARGIPNITWELLSTKPSYLSNTIGILPDLLNTVYIVIATLLIVLPLGVGSAIYLTEYAANKRLVAMIEYAAETLSGIPSIIYGLVGMLFFCQFLNMQTSLLAGALTLVIMNLPTIMRTTEESLKTVPQSYREGAFGLGAGKCRLHSGGGPDSRRIGGAAVHGGLCARAQRLFLGSEQRGRHADRCAVFLCEGGGRVRRRVCNCGHSDAADAACEPCLHIGRTILQEKEKSMSDIITVNDLCLWYGGTQALNRIHIRIPERSITALIGPSGCGKSTFLKTLNRMNDLIPGVRVTGSVCYQGMDIFGAGVDVNALRRSVGMVFQKPNPFPMSIYDNVAYGPRTHGVTNRAKLDDIVENSLRSAAIWDEVKDRLKKSALGLSGGQQQRLCIARALAVEPEVLLMDEPTSALDPISTSRIEELAIQLKGKYTIIIVTHNMQQAARISDRTAFFLLGELIECGDTEQLFAQPQDKRTEDYITGRFG